ncbi:putative Ig domain-containing protein, partial [Streptomyces sp. S12]|nr:putative Ig domain-containing protein [Streptomyces sp. S12]
NRAYSFNVSAATVTVAPATLPNGGIAQAYSQTITASGGTPGYSFAVTAGALPAGVTLNAATGTLSGTPTASGTFNFAVIATDSSTGSGPYNSAPQRLRAGGRRHQAGGQPGQRHRRLRQRRQSGDAQHHRRHPGLGRGRGGAGARHRRRQRHLDHLPAR